MPSGVYKRTEKHKNSGYFKTGQVPWNKGLTKKDPRVKKYGKKIGDTKRGKPLKHDKQFKKGIEPWNKGQHIENKGTYKKGHLGLKGEKNPNWNGGPKKIQEFRRTNEYNEWRKNVFERDNFTCRKCNVKGGKLIADHHPFGFSKYPEKMYDIDNGRTLCEKCNYVVTYIQKNWR